MSAHIFLVEDEQGGLLRRKSWGVSWVLDPDRATWFEREENASWSADIQRGAGTPCKVVTLEAARRTHEAAPPDSRRPGSGGDATERAPASDLAEAGGADTPTQGGAAQWLQQELGLVAPDVPACDLASGEGPERNCTSATLRARETRPSPPDEAAVQRELYGRCPLCGDPLPDAKKRGLFPATCQSDRCKREHQRRKRWERETKARRARKAVTQ